MSLTHLTKNISKCRKGHTQRFIFSLFKQGKSKNQKNKGEFCVALDKKQELFGDCSSVVLHEAEEVHEKGAVQCSTPARHSLRSLFWLRAPLRPLSQ